MSLSLESLMGAFILVCNGPKVLFEVTQRSDARYFGLAQVSRCDELTSLYQNGGRATL